MSYYRVRTENDVTKEIADAAKAIAVVRYPTGPIDWDDILGDLNGITLASGETLDLGESLLSPGITEIKARVRAHRRKF